MNLSLATQQYWQLVRTLMFPLRGVRWIAVGTLGLMVLGGLLLLLTGSPIVLIISVAMCLTVVVAAIIILPMQMLSMVSSKQFFWISGLRNKTFVIIFSLNCLITLLVVLALESKPNDLSMINVSAMVFLVTSIVSFFMLLGRVYFQAFMPFFFAGMWGVYFLGFKWLYDYGLLNFSISIIIWLCFYRWWCGWVPQKFFQNYLALSPDKMLEHQSQSAGVEVFYSWGSSAPRSLCGTLLSGVSDGIKSWLKYEMGQIIVISIMLLVFFFLFRDGPKEIILKILPVIVFTFVVARNAQVQMLCYRNLSRIWMFFEGPRNGLFPYLEKQCFINMGIVCIELFIMLVAIHFLFDGINFGQGLIVFAVVIGNLFSALLFYLGWVIYHKTEANTVWLGWITSSLVVIVIIILGLRSIFGPSDINYTELWSKVGVILVLTLLARFWAGNGWKKMNFYRVKTDV
jgi:hypothetical protein